MVIVMLLFEKETLEKYLLCFSSLSFRLRFETLILFNGVIRAESLSKTLGEIFTRLVVVRLLVGKSPVATPTTVVSAERVKLFVDGLIVSTLL
jgi:hypothetical protein